MKDYELIYSNKEKEEDIKNIPLFNSIDLGKYEENKLIFGDNLNILKILMKDYNKKIKLIYIDPPFSTDRQFIDLDKNHAYSDEMVGSEFIEFIRKRLILAKELLSEEGSIYVHLDQKKGHYIKIIMDEIFGEENFINDITRIKCNPKSFERKAFGNIKDVIYFYAKDKNKLFWKHHKKPLNKIEIEKQFPKIDKDGRRYATTPIHAPGETENGATGQEWKGMKPPKGRHWRYSPDELTKLDEVELIEWSKTGNPRKKIYADEHCGNKIQDIWEFKDPGIQRAIYPTEKNEYLLDLIIQSSSNKGDLIMDFFCGSGTTLLSAEKLLRNWIGIDNSEMAIEKTKKKLATLENLRPYKFLKFE